MRYQDPALIAEEKSLGEIVRRHSHNQPDQRAVTFLVEDGIEKGHLSYGELDRKARSIGARLQSLAGRGERAVLIYPQGLDFVPAFLGCLYSGVVAIPTHPPRLNKRISLIELQAIVAQSRAKFVLGTDQIISNLRDRPADFSYRASTDDLIWIATDTVSREWSEDWREEPVDSESLAYIQYTSGSTSDPKGVMVSHQNLMYNLAYVKRAMEFSPSSVGLSWLPSAHDMGLVTGILEHLYVGSSAYLMTPASFAQNPGRWLQAISSYHVTHSGAPNFAYDHCVDNSTPEQRANLDLSSWLVAYNGAETVRQETLLRFARTFAPNGFRFESWYPCYGLAESVLMVSGGRVGNPPVFSDSHNGTSDLHSVADSSLQRPGAKGLVGSGTATLETRVIAVDPDSLIQCRPGEIGEIWVSGPTTAKGYWDLPEESVITFQAHLADGEGPFLRTGDLGFLEDGEIFITGRLKELIIIHGRNHYPQDIELTVGRSHPALRPNSASAFSIEVDGVERLVVAQEVRRDFLKKVVVAGVAQEIRSEVAEQHGINTYAVVLVRPGSIPKTRSGKARRQETRDRFLRDALEIVDSGRPNQETEERFTGYDGSRGVPDRRDFFEIEPEIRQSWVESYLLTHLAETLGEPPQRLDPQKSISYLGLDSLMVAELQHKIEVELGVIFSYEALMSNTSLKELATDACEQLGRVGAGFSVNTGLPRIGNSNGSSPCHGDDYSVLAKGRRTLFQRLVRKLGRPLLRLVARVSIEGEENIPASGPLLLAFNHLHFSDGFLFFLFVPRRVVFLVGEGWKTKRIFNWIFTHLGSVIYINRGKGDLEAINQALAVLRAEGALLIAPEGGISDGASLGEGKSGIAHLSTLAPAPIVPMVAYGQERTGSYWKRLRRVPVHVRIGPPIVLPPEQKGRQHIQGYTDIVMGELARMLPPEYRGVYGHTILTSEGRPRRVDIG